MPHALIQLVSEQTMPNVLAALALEPKCITLIHTRRTQDHAGWINRALQRAGLAYEVELRSLSAAPDIHEAGAMVRSVAEEAVAQGLTPVVNITGGTKLMSIGAFAATVKPGWASLYVDTENRRLLQAGGQHLPEALRDTYAALLRAEKRMNVDVMAAAHGCEQVSAGKHAEPYVELAEYLRRNPVIEQQCNAIMRDVLTRGFPKQVLSQVDKPFPSDFPAEVLRQAATVGLVEQWSDGTWHFSCPERDVLEQALCSTVPIQDIFAATEPVQFAHAFLSGAWWEVCVWNAARQSGHFRDLRWSVKFGSEVDHLEEDLVAVKGLSLAVFSCKRGGHGDRLNRAFEEFVSASNRLGGSFAEKYFCVAQAIRKDSFSAVQSQAARVHAKLIGPSEKLSSSSFGNGL